MRGPREVEEANRRLRELERLSRAKGNVYGIGTICAWFGGGGDSGLELGSVYCRELRYVKVLELRQELEKRSGVWADVLWVRPASHGSGGVGIGRADRRVWLYDGGRDEIFECRTDVLCPLGRGKLQWKGGKWRPGGGYTWDV